MSTLQERNRQNRIAAGRAHQEELKRLGEVKRLAAPMAYGYGRVSHASQVDGESVEAQGARTHGFYNLNLKEQGVEWAGFFGEKKNVSAYKKSFFDRPTGKLLISKLKEGDHVICDKVDRLWRSIYDFSDLVRWFKERKIILHFANMGGASLTSGTPMGDFGLQIMVLVAELESANKSQRIKDAFEYGASQGYWKHPEAPLGTSIRGKKPKRYLVWNWDERGIMSEIVRLRDDEKMTTWQIWKELKPKFEALREAGKLERNWIREKLATGYVYEKHYRLVATPQEVDFKYLSTIRFKMSAAAHL